MTPTHLHLLVNHLPIIGAFLALPLLLIALWRRTELGALLGAVLVLALAASGAVVADQTGEGAEHEVEELPGVSETLIHEHEERAEIAMPISLVTAVAGLGLLAWSWRRGETPRMGAGGLLVAATVSAGAMAWTGWAGGQIRHTEIRAERAGIDEPAAP